MRYILAKDEEQINLACAQMQKFLLALVLAATMFMAPVWASILLPEEVANYFVEVLADGIEDEATVEDETDREMSCSTN